VINSFESRTHHYNSYLEILSYLFSGYLQDRHKEEIYNLLGNRTLKTVRGLDNILHLLPRENSFELINISESAKHENKTETIFASLVSRLNGMEFEFIEDHNEVTH